MVAPEPESLPASFDLADACGLVRILEKAGDSPDSFQGRRKKILDGLCDLIGADGWGGFLISAPSLAESAAIRTMRGFPEEEADHIRESAGTGLTAGAREFARCGPVTFFRAHATLSGRRLPAGISIIGVFRKGNLAPFVDRERRLAQMVFEEVTWVHDQPDHPAPRQQPALTPRLREILPLLKQGHDRKTIADIMGISPHTAASHMREIYRKFGVGNQLELIRKTAASL